jgi:hypothetical protein
MRLKCGVFILVLTKCILRCFWDGKKQQGILRKPILENRITIECVDVDKSSAARAEAFVKGYLVDYSCKDEHKAPYRDWDAQWRIQMGLDPLYDSVTNPLVCLKKKVNTILFQEE